MNRSFRPLGHALVFACAGLLLSCTPQKEKQQEPKPEQPTASKETQARPSLKASEDDCVGPLTRAKKPRQVSFGEWKFSLDGYLAQQLNKRGKPNELVVGVISDSKENTEDNQKNLDTILDFFEQEKVDLILHLGDVASVMAIPDDVDVPEKDEEGKALSKAQRNRIRRRLISKARREAMKKSYDDMVEMLSILAETEMPVLVIIGNRECKSIFNSALTTLQEDFPNLFNMNLVRRVELDTIDIISMPGYHDPEYVHCPWDKCLYYQSDTLSLIDLAKEAGDKPVLLISHGPPRQKDRNGIDAVSEGANVGNPALTAAIRKANIPFGAFGNIQEAGGKATNIDGTSIVDQNTFVSSFYLNPGPADSMIWSMNDGTESKGMAAVIHFVGDKAKYKIFRIGEVPARPDSSGKGDSAVSPKEEPAGKGGATP
ncbi:MAG: metallophosphoesterase [Deltaproteobacteria bacterium]|nr:metallophosphoesterase [Deltaproteobacteria bacterium]